MIELDYQNREVWTKEFPVIGEFIVWDTKTLSLVVSIGETFFRVCEFMETKGV